MSDDEEDFVAASEDAGAFVMLTHPPPGLVYAVEKATGRMFWARRGEREPKWKLLDSDDPEFAAASAGAAPMSARS
jgi:hypothetical protein